MPWFNVDDKAHDDPAFRQVGLDGFGLFAAAGSYCMDRLTDGRVPSWFIASWPGGPEAADKLVTAGLWAYVDGGCQFTEWKDALSRAVVLARKARWRKEKQRRQERQWSGDDSDEDSDEDSGADSGAETEKSQLTEISGVDSGVDSGVEGLVIGQYPIPNTQ